MTNAKDTINQLYKILDELNAREISCNCIVPELSGIGWTDLCKKGEELFELLKKSD